MRDAKSARRAASDGAGEVDEAMARSIYAIPLVTTDVVPVTPTAIVRVTAAIAGFRLYQNRGSMNAIKGDEGENYSVVYAQATLRLAKFRQGITTLDAALKTACSNNPQIPG